MTKRAVRQDFEDFVAQMRANGGIKKNFERIHKYREANEVDEYLEPHEISEILKPTK